MDKEIFYLKKYFKGTNLDEKIELYKQGFPLQYLIGDVNFFGYQIKVNENVLIPRFETELLVDKTIKYIEEYLNKEIKILDLCTGSGCVAIALQKKLNAIVTASDISLEAIEVAKENSHINDAEINFIVSDIFSNINDKYDVIISNPPYIAYDDEVADIVKNNEPHIALYAPNDGLFFYQEILRYANDYLNDKFIIALEIGNKQGSKIVSLAKKYFRDSEIKLEKDLTGLDRYVFIIKS
jgi:release factor glutamine methyltransferase